jgi:phosphopantothenoylcysteine decarboxylase/phosphopantothenate--cysteine ligase
VLHKKHILLGVTGGIAAYKIPYLVRDLCKAGADVRVVMTDAAKEFVTPLTLSTLSGHEVIAGIFPAAEANIVDAGTWHIKLGQWADVMLIAPATANVLAKLAHGEADTAVTTLALALRCPLMVAPAMDVDMWRHAATQANVTSLRERGVSVLPPETGELASGLKGPGRLPETAALLQAIDDVVSGTRRDLKGKRLVVTAGPTQEALDAVRFLGNRSSGKMGFALANAAAQRGADVTLIAGPVGLQTPPNVRRVDVESAAEMYTAVIRQKKCHALIMAAAVADFTPVKAFDKKLKKDSIPGGTLRVELRKTRDILAEVGRKNRKTLLVGFALETNNGLRNARAKLKEKHLDLVVLNNPKEKGAGFGTDTNVVTLIARSGKADRLKRMAKYDVANVILDRVAKLMAR